MNIEPFNEDRVRQLYDQFIREHPDADISWEDALKAARMAHEEFNKPGSAWSDPSQIIRDVANQVVSDVNFSIWKK